MLDDGAHWIGRASVLLEINSSDCGHVRIAVLERYDIKNTLSRSWKLTPADRIEAVVLEDIICGLVWAGQLDKTITALKPLHAVAWADM